MKLVCGRWRLSCTLLSTPVFNKRQKDGIHIQAKLGSGAANERGSLHTEALIFSLKHHFVEGLLFTPFLASHFEHLMKDFKPVIMKEASLRIIVSGLHSFIVGRLMGSLSGAERS